MAGDELVVRESRSGRNKDLDRDMKHAHGERDTWKKEERVEKQNKKEQREKRKEYHHLFGR